MKVLGLIFVLLLPGLSHAEPQYYGSRAVAISLDGTASQTDLQLLPIRTGDTITSENVRDSIQALYDTGRYAYIEVDAAPADTGTRLIFRVRPRFFFSTIRLEPKDLLERPLSGYLRLPIGERFSRSALDRIIEQALEVVKAQGYFEAAINPDIKLDETTRLASILLRVDAGPQAKVGTVQITGGEQTFTASEMLDAFDMKQGDDYLVADIDKGIAEIREKFLDLGFLNTRVTVDPVYESGTKTVALNLTVQPGIFALVDIRGYGLSKNRMQELIPIFEEGTVDVDLVEEGRAELEQYLKVQGYFDASVTAELIEVPTDNAVQINYTVSPGESYRIRSIHIEGNDYFSEDDIRERLQIRTAGLFDSGAFSPEILEEDRRTILTMYRAAGFEDTEIRASFEEPEHAVDVTILITEGAQLPVEYISFLGNSDLTEQELRKTLPFKEGDTYTVAELHNARNALVGFYYSQGYPDVRVEANAERVVNNHGMRVRFEITEGESFYIGKIFVAGNERTQDKIVHRYARLYPNTPYNPEAILEGQQRLYATGLFARVEIVTLEQDLPTSRDLLIQVEDAKPILVTYGVGFQEYEKLRGTVEFSHNNLFGLDRGISLRVRGSRREQRFQSTYREPRLFNRDIDGFASLFMERRQRPDYTADRFDFSIQTLKRLTPQQTFLLTASYQTANLRDIRINPRAETFKEERGIIQTARIGASFIQDRRDDPIDPTAGSFNSTTFQVASKLLRSEVNFTSLFNQSNYYTTMGPGVLANSVRLGWNQPFGKRTELQRTWAAAGGLPITERYFAGGSTTLRGYDVDEALPGGGNVMTIGNVEYRVPFRRFPIRGVGGALFYDFGNVFPRIADIKVKDFTHTAGFGLRYNTPLGPVRLDFGFNLRPRVRLDGSREERVQVFFTLGHPF